jgi:nicotinamide-nucleotide amidase
LERQSNPTVGLTAHSGIVDVRIAAKASTHVEAENLISETEQDIRRRLGGAIFGADEDSLENVVLNAIAQCDWNLATVESGLGDSLMKRLNATSHPAYRGGTSRDVRPDALVQSCVAFSQEMNASAILGVSLSTFGEHQDIAIVIITPLGQEERHLKYGGHPRNAARWAVNTALDGLRRIVLEKE